MQNEGWLLDVSIDGGDMVLWLKTVAGEVVEIRERYRPRFHVAPKRGVNIEELTARLEEHPSVYAVEATRRFASLRRRRLIDVVRVTVESVEDLPKVESFVRGLKEAGSLYDVDLRPVQWYLFRRGVAPSDRVLWTGVNGRLEEIRAVDDGLALEPPPFKPLIFSVDQGDRITVYDGEFKTSCVLEGGEATALSRFEEIVEERDPDLLVAESVSGTVRGLLDRAKALGFDLCLGRGGGGAPSGRVLLELKTFREVGLAGLVEKARFTLAPLGMCADWPAGKTIDSRQCYEAWRLGVLIPESRGGYGYVSTAWDLARRDRGGLILSPRVGLHENVGCLDFESMFPNIIVRRNVSYETVGPEGVDQSRPGFLGGFTRRFLERRLYFKHLRSRFPVGSREWVWCEQRQLALKLVLVCIYGYSGCFANRFGNVRVFQEINRVARRVLVQAMNIALERGFEVIYGNSDSLFVKKLGAARWDYEELAGEIATATGLPIRLDRHFRFLVLLSKASDPRTQAANHYYGKLMDGSLFCRGMELRRHDTPPFIKRLQMRGMKVLFDAESAEEVMDRQLPKVQKLVEKACGEIIRGEVEAEELVISKMLRRRPSEYASKQPHVVAAELGAEDNVIKYLFTDAGRVNPYMRVMPVSLLNGCHHGYDRKKYAELVRRAAENLLRPIL
ncbi:hypothetical protein DRO42_02675 [Candidatus Bathyarchaeota archaeon]|nr:MAG: hypothetical protein DRO42_02675 [Candidatus Bathyarchaeota archaeon]